MKIYSMILPFEQDEPIYQAATFSDPFSAQSEEGLDIYRSGGALFAEWVACSRPPQIGTAIMFPTFGILSSADVVGRLKPFAPFNTVNPVAFHGQPLGSYCFLQPKACQVDDTGTPHVFLIFKTYKKLLVTEKFVEFWQAQAYTGALFEFVCEMPDHQFIPIDHKAYCSI